MQVYGSTSVHAPQSIGAPHHARTSGSPSSAGGTQIADQLDLSPSASFLDAVHQMPDIRSDRVAELKAQIASGAYDSADKLDAALDRLLDELA